MQFMAKLSFSYKKGEGTLDCEVLAVTEHVPNPSKCQTLVQGERDNVIFKFEQQSIKDTSFFLPPKEMQCPCAGSIIIELRDTPVIIQPNIAFHESLINVHFKQHKCFIRTVATTVGEASTSSFDA